MRAKFFIVLASLIAAVALMIAAYGFGVGIGAQTRVIYRTAPPPVSAGTSPSVPAPTMEALQAQVNDISEDAKRIDKIVTLLLGLASFYAIALGLSSYFGLKQILETARHDSAEAVSHTQSDSQRALDKMKSDMQSALTLATEQSTRTLDKVENDTRTAINVAHGEAGRVLDEVTTESKRTLTRAKEDFDRFADEIRQNYPEIANLHSNLRELVHSITLFQERGNWSDSTWAKLSDRQREDTQMAEFRFAGLEVFALSQLSTYTSEVTAICQGFARFYSSRFKALKARGDWERGCIYFERALRNAAPKPALLKDQGVHLTQLEVARQTEIDNLGGIDHLPPAEFLELQSLRTRAEMAFLESLKLNTAEPGALFGLGWLNFRKNEFAGAAGRYTALIDLGPSAHSGRPQEVPGR